MVADQWELTRKYTDNKNPFSYVNEYYEDKAGRGRGRWWWGGGFRTSSCGNALVCMLEMSSSEEQV